MPSTGVILLVINLVLTVSEARKGNSILIWESPSRGVPEEFAPAIGELFSRLYSFSSHDAYAAFDNLTISEKCLEDVQYTLQHYLTTSWGLKMLDSNAKIPEGVLQGSFVDFGHYEECVGIDESSGRFQGQHCMADIKLSLAVLKLNLPLFYGVCVPSTCNSSDVEKLVNSVTETLKLPAVVTVDPNNCRLRGIPDPSAGDWVVVGVFFAFVLIGIVSTVYDVYQRFKKDNQKPHQLWSAFSFYTNGKYLLSTTKDPAMMTSLFGLRTITMGWVVLGHVYLNSVFSPITNLADVNEMSKDHSKVIIFNSFVSVDTFYLLSGMLVCFVFFRNMGKNRTFDQPLGYIHRYIRLTPPYAAMILFEATVVKYMGNGPWWNRIHADASANCKNYWWSSLLYVQNYVNPLSLCLTQTWYISADMQMYWVSPLILYPMHLFPALAVPYLGFLILFISFLDFTIVYLNDLPANFVVNPSDDRMALDYYPFHTRMAPWLIGVALGYLICGIRAKKIRVNLSPMWVTCGWILSTLLMTASFQCMDYFDQNPGYTALESAFFLAFHRVGWGLGLAWLIFACTNGLGGPVDKILSWTLFQPLAKLSYCAYLVHISVQRFRIGWARTNSFSGDVENVWLFLGDFVVSNLVSIPFFLLFEQPFLHVSRFLFNGVTIFNWPKPRARKPASKKDVEAPVSPQGSLKNPNPQDDEKSELEEKRN